MPNPPLAMRFSVDDGSDEPVYQQIAAQLRVQIERGERAPGERLPAIRTLAAALGLHRDTVALAYEQLGRSGLVEARVGAGTFVRSLLATGRSGAEGEARALVADGAETPARVPGFQLALAPPVEQLIALDNTRPRYASGEDVVALHRLIPDPRLYPIEEFAACFEAALREEGPSLFSYASPEGDPRLRRAIASRFRRYGMALAAEELVLCHGASQGISLVLRLFTQPGDQIAVEVPTYANVLSAAAAHGVTPAAVPMDAEGVEPEALDRVLARPEVKLFYTIPSFHNPLGTTTALARRRQILEIAARHGVPVIEDGFELDLRFRGRDVAPLAALDETGIVVHLYSFSKSLFPGVRVGALAARGRALEGLVALKHATDLSDALTLQAALARFVESGAFDRHLVRIRRVLAARHAALAAALAAVMPPGTSWTEPEGGHQCWVELPFEVDTRDLLADAARAGVVFSPGTLFMPDARPSRGMRLAVAGVDEDEIARGLDALGRVVRERAARAPGEGREAGMHL